MEQMNYSGKEIRACFACNKVFVKAKITEGNLEQGLRDKLQS